MQTKRQSFIEAVTNTVIGYVIAVLLTYVIMDAWGHKFSWGDSSKYVAIFYVVSTVRSYLLRRFFNWYQT